MRIIGGKARGTKLYTLDGDNTRPTLDRVKESLFNIIQTKIPESVFLDLFSGSGSIGLEAASRRAKKVILCDNSKAATQIIKKNITKTHLESKTECYQLSYEKLLENKINEKLDIIYIDPPYKTDYIEQSIKLIDEYNMLNEDGLIICENDSLDKIVYPENYEVVKDRKYGDKWVVILKKIC